MPDLFTTSNWIPSLATALVPYVLARIQDSEFVSKFLQGRDSFHVEAEDLLKKALPTAIKDVSLPPYKVRAFLECPKTLKEMCNWILSDFEDGVDLLMGDLPFDAYSDPGQERIQLQEFTTRLAGQIQINKRQSFSVATLNILSGQSRIEDKIDSMAAEFEATAEVVSASVTSLSIMPEQIRQIIRSELVSGRISEEVSGDIEEAYLSEIEQIKILIKQGNVRTALDMALGLESRLENSSTRDNEALFLVYAHIAEAYLESIDNTPDVITYLHKASEIDSNVARKHRNRALSLFYQGHLDQGLDEIEKSLSIDSGKEEAINIKANLLVAFGDASKMDSFLETIVPTDNAKLIFSRALLQNGLGRYQDSLQSITSAIEIEPTWTDPYRFGVDLIMSKASKDLNEYGFVRPSTAELFDIGIRYAMEFSALLGDEQIERRAEALAMRGAFHSWMNERESAKQCFDKAHILWPDNLMILRNLALACWVSDHVEDALDHLIILREMTPGDAEIDMIIADIHLTLGNPQQAIEDLESRIAGMGQSKLDFRLHHMLIRAYDRNFQSTEAQQKLHQWREEHGDQPWLMIARADHLTKLGHSGEAVEILESLIEGDEGKPKTLATLVLADLLFEEGTIRGFQRAARLYERIININRPDRPLKRYAECLYECNEVELCVEICKKAQGHGDGFIEEFAFLEARAYAENDHLLLAAEILKRLAQRHPDHVSYLVNYGHCLYRTNRPADAYEVARQARVKADSVHEMIFVGHAYESMGHFAESVSIAGEVLQKDFSDPDLHLHYAVTFHRATNAGYTPAPDQIESFQDIFDKFNERFPDDDRLQKREVPTDPDDMIEDLKELLAGIGKRSQLFQDEYDKRKLPLAFLAKGLGRDRLTTWSTLTNRPTLKVWSSSGNAEELIKECEVAASSKVVIVDLVPLLTLKALGLQERLAECFETVIIPQAIVDEINETIHRLEFLSQEDGMSIWEEDGVLHRQDIPGNNIRNTIEQMRDISEFVTTQCVVTGKSIGRKFDAELENNLRNVIDDAATEVLIESHERGIPMYTDDMAMKYICGRKVNVDGFCTRSLLDVLLRRDLISEEAYYRATRSLVALNYHFTPISARSLVWSIESTGYEQTIESLILFESLRHQDNDVLMLINLSVGFLRSLWEGNLPIAIRAKWTDVLLFSITHRRSKSEIVDSIMQRRREIIPPILPAHSLQEFEITVQTWLVGQSVI